VSEDAIRVTTVVTVPPAEAFAVFTGEIDLWWRKGPRYRPLAHPQGAMRLEPRAGGRLLEVYGEGDGEAFEIGRVRVWEPPDRLVLTWRERSFLPDEETEVEIRFAAHDGGTFVSLEHRGFGALRDDHPARRGLGRGIAFASSIALWWGEQLQRVRDRGAAGGKRA
jgi:uncharacterized protein YndB with AHSA1/START domain